MGVTRTDLFNREQNELAILAKAFAHPARIAILQFLLSSNKCINNELVNELGLAQATISQHLRELKNVGLIQGNIEGVSMSYCINPEKWENVRLLFSDLFNKLDVPKPGDCC
jgi:predicted transcriptional regulator